MKSKFERSPVNKVGKFEETSLPSDEPSSVDFEDGLEFMDFEGFHELSEARKRDALIKVSDKGGNQDDHIKHLKALLKPRKSRNLIGSGCWKITQLLNEGPISAKMLAARRFCALCEVPIESYEFGRHLLAAPHKGGDDRVYMFNDESVVVAPAATKVMKETLRCKKCFGMFFRCRVKKHRCPFSHKQDPLCPEMTPEKDLNKRFYCLMCQIRFKTQPMLLRHWKEFHNETPNSYVIENIRGLETLHPATIIYDEALQFCCDYCQEFTYKERTPVLCKKAAYYPFKYRSVTLTNKGKGSCK